MTENWESIRRCVELGVPFKDVSDKFGVTETALRKQASRNKWLVPNRLEKLKQEAALRLETGECQSGVLSEISHAPPQNTSPNVPELVGVTLAQIGDQLRHVVAGKALSALKKADLSSLPINNWQDAKIAAEVGLKAAGLDNASGPSVNVLFGGTGFGSDPSPLIEIDAANFTSQADSDTEIL